MRTIGIVIGLVIAVGIASVVWMAIARRAAPQGGGSDDTAAAAPSEAKAAPPVEAAAPAIAAAGQDRVIAYYFHWTTRCQSCLDIEEYSREAIAKTFATDLEQGRLEWHAYNMERPPHEHFQADFDLSTPSLVLVRIEHGAIVQWKVLEEVWQLVDMPWDLEDYVVSEAREYVGRISPSG